MLGSSVPTSIGLTTSFKIEMLVLPLSPCNHISNTQQHYFMVQNESVFDPRYLFLNLIYMIIVYTDEIKGVAQNANFIIISVTLVSYSMSNHFCHNNRSVKRFILYTERALMKILFTFNSNVLFS